MVISGKTRGSPNDSLVGKHNSTLVHDLWFMVYIYIYIFDYS